jgi:cellulose synthase/poly-beta-1,6-N-acetylglucosamine synthase-like glycosyltransferase
MIAAAAALLLAALALALWSYLVYPALLGRLARRAPPLPLPGAPAPDLTVEALVSAADEEEEIGGRVRNLLDQGPEVRVLVGCDGCRDATAERARAAGDGRVRVLEFPLRRGKASVLNDLLEHSRAQVLVFTDANTRFEPGAAEALLRPFSDPRVGAVCGRLLLEPGEGNAAEPEAAFWDRETRWKQLEGRLGICLGANGAIYAARRELIRPLPPHSAMDDFLIPARIAGKGWKVVFAGDAVAREEGAPDVRSEMARRFRIGVGAGRILREERWLFSVRRHPLLSFAFFSRKLARWLAPVLALAAALVALGPRETRPFALAALAFAVAAAALAWARPRLRGVGGRLYYFGVINLAIAAGVVAGFAGYRRPVWSRTAR